MGQFPWHGRFIVRQITVVDDVPGLVVAALQQFDDGLELLGFQVVNEFFQDISSRVTNPCRRTLTLSNSCSQWCSNDM